MASWFTHGSVLSALLAVLALGCLGTGFASALQFDVVRQTGATLGTSVTNVIPIVGVILGRLVPPAST